MHTFMTPLVIIVDYYILSTPSAHLGKKIDSDIKWA